MTDTNTANNTATDTTLLVPQVDLTVTKTDGVTSVTAGGTVTYTIVVTNDGPSAVSGATLVDVLPAELRDATWTCSAAAGASCATASGSGSPAVVVDIDAGSSVSVTIDATVVPSARGTLSNTATVSTPSGVTDSNPADNSATDVDAVLAVADLSISKTDGRTDALPGDTLTYTIDIANAGPSQALGALVQDAIPAELSVASWTCLATAGSSCGATSGSGDIAERVDLDTGGSVTFTVTAVVRPDATGTVVNTATVEAPSGVSDPTPANNAANDSTMLSPLSDVSITKTDGVSTIVAGAPTTYSVVVTNPGPSAIAGVRVTDSLPAVLTGATWTCSPTGGASCGASSGIASIDEVVDLPAASTVRYTVTATVDAGASGTIANTAAVTLPGVVVDPTPSNNTSTDTTTVTGEADLSIVKTNGSSTVVPGTRTDYTITATNVGPSNALGARIVDMPPASLTGVTWSCSANGGAMCSSTSGTGSVDLLVDIPVGGSISIALGADVSIGASGPVANTATISPAAGTTDPDLSDNQSTDTDTVTPVADVSVTKTDGTDTVVPGTTTTYTVVVTNAGPSPADGVSVVDLLPTGVSSATWTCTPTSGAWCSAASGSGSINTTVNLSGWGLGAVRHDRLHRTRRRRIDREHGDRLGALRRRRPEPRRQHRHRRRRDRGDHRPVDHQDRRRGTRAADRRGDLHDRCIQCRTVCSRRSRRERCAPGRSGGRDVDVFGDRRVVVCERHRHRQHLDDRRPVAERQRHLRRPGDRGQRCHRHRHEHRVGGASR